MAGKNGVCKLEKRYRTAVETLRQGLHLPTVEKGGRHNELYQTDGRDGSIPEE